MPEDEPTDDDGQAAVDAAVARSLAAGHALGSEEAWDAFDRVPARRCSWSQGLHQNLCGRGTRPWDTKAPPHYAATCTHQ
jgi:hypothetical protein